MDNDDTQGSVNMSDNDVDDTLGSNYPIDESEDKNIQPDDELAGYQDELGTGEQEDIVLGEQSEDRGDTPAQLTGMPEGVVKEELDNLAVDERGHDSQEDDDTREHIEDMDENEKEH